MYGITEAVNDQIRQAQARHSNFEMGIRNHRDSHATSYFESIALQLEEEAARVRNAMNDATIAVRLGRERHGITS